MGLFDEDVLRKEKLQLLCAHGMLSLTDIGNSVSGGNIFVLKLGLVKDGVLTIYLKC